MKEKTRRRKQIISVIFKHECQDSHTFAGSACFIFLCCFVILIATFHCVNLLFIIPKLKFIFDKTKVFSSYKAAGLVAVNVTWT